MKKRKIRKESWRSYKEMNKFQRWCVHNGFFNFWRINKNGECEYLTNNKRENKIIQQIYNRERT